MIDFDRRGGAKIVFRTGSGIPVILTPWLWAWLEGGGEFDSIVFNFKIFQFIFMYIEQKCPEKETGSVLVNDRLRHFLGRALRPG